MSSSPAGQVAEVELIPDFASLLRQHQRMVFTIALHMVRDPMAAEEIAQDVFLKLHQELRSMKSSAHIEFWLRRVAVHRAIDYERKHRHDPNVALEELQMPAKEEPGTDPFLARRLQALVASLPEKARAVVVLRYQEELMPEEIAALLRIPVGTVKSHLQRSLAMLREKLGRTLGEVSL
ncbi:MAG TPA: sigma-70 family RNA polymerase sigma factor [Terriglobales bacterium]|nr:sigma-70 family RNA polymerase sigma factor [Terriglobales bacterium]